MADDTLPPAPTFDPRGTVWLTLAVYFRRWTLFLAISAATMGPGLVAWAVAQSLDGGASEAAQNIGMALWLLAPLCSALLVFATNDAVNRQPFQLRLVGRRIWRRLGDLYLLYLVFIALLAWLCLTWIVWTSILAVATLVGVTLVGTLSGSANDVEAAK